MIPPVKPLPESVEALHERQRWQLTPELRHDLAEAMDDWGREDKTRRLWEGDPLLWTNADEANWLGWLTITDVQLGRIETFIRLAGEVQTAGFEQILLLGMGGSVLCLEVLARTVGSAPGYPQLLVLDSTDPAQIRRFASRIDCRKTLFIVSSKSGATLETNLLKQFFYEETKKAIGPDQAGSHFIAVTDPGSPLEQVARAERFRRVYPGEKSIGGRFSALSNFGMVPAAAMGLDVKDFLTRTQKMVRACGPDVPLPENLGVMLGLILGVAGNAGRDKITLVTSPGIRDLGAWVEQLLAESTGKNGKGLIPIDQEELGVPGMYWEDRLFCYVREDGAADPVQDGKMEALAEAGHPVVLIDLCDKYDLGQEFFRWEIAVATAGSLLGINPFDQPDVEASKIATRRLTAEYEAKGSLPEETPLVEGDGMKLFADSRNAADLAGLTRDAKSTAALLGAHLQRLRPGDYFALLAFADMNEENKAILQAVQNRVRDCCHVATSLGFGPRYLHSTGQAFKGGPNTGVFLQVTCDHPVDLPVPGHKYTFGVVEAAQARGDFSVLAERGRRALRVHLSTDGAQGLTRLRKQIVNALK